MLRSLSESTVACVTAGKVYDVTEWAEIHPGRDIPLMNLADQDVTVAFIAFHPGLAWIICTTPPKAAPKPSTPAPTSPPLAALFTSELSQPSSSRPKEGMAAVFQEIGSKPVTSLFFYFWSNPLINPVIPKILLPLLFNLF
ncbi:delta(8)-fatty-acid desaturase-like protein [Tanacetum coccineum]